MTPLELLAVLIFAGAIIILLYIYMQERNLSFSSLTSGTGDKARSTVSGASKKIKVEGNNGGVGEAMSGMSEKARSAFSGASEKVKVDSSMMEGVSDKVSGVSEKLKGTVKGVPQSTDEFSNKIDLFLEERQEQIIKDWELATKTDLSDIEKRYTKVSGDMGKLNSSFNEYRESTNKKLKKIEERLDKLETPKNIFPK
jgi:archaellum component FlaC